MTEAKKTGRPPLPPDEKLHRVTLFVPPDVLARIKAHGQEWARAVLRRAKPPKP